MGEGVTFDVYLQRGEAGNFDVIFLIYPPFGDVGVSSIPSPSLVDLCLTVRGFFGDTHVDRNSVGLAYDAYSPKYAMIV